MEDLGVGSHHLRAQRLIYKNDGERKRRVYLHNELFKKLYEYYHSKHDKLSLLFYNRTKRVLS